MKTSIYLTAICIISLSIFLIWSKFEVNNHDLSISVSENDETYEFSASYNRGYSAAIWAYINSSIAPNKLGQSENDYLDVTTVLQGNTKFHIKEAPGEVKIVLDKKGNSTASYYRIKKMCQGIRGILAGK